jgi:uncharacterized phiE125 gp8 family phage protein
MSGIVTGQSVLIDRLPYGSVNKVAPVSTQALRDHIQLTHTLDDNIVLGVGGYLFAAAEEAEGRGVVSLIRQQRKQIIGSDVGCYIAGQGVELSYGPVISVSAVKYLDSDGVEQTLDTSAYRVSVSQNLVYFRDNPPSLADGPGTIWIEYEAGFGDNSDSVPAVWQNIVMTIAMRRYEYRGGDTGSTNAAWERMIRQMVNVAGGSYRA